MLSRERLQQRHFRIFRRHCIAGNQQHADQIVVTHQADQLDHALFAELGVGASRLTLDTLSGPLTVARHGARYEMDFPAMAPRRIDPPAGLAAALGFEPLEVWAAQFIVAIARSSSASSTGHIRRRRCARPSPPWPVGSRPVIGTAIETSI